MILRYSLRSILAQRGSSVSILAVLISTTAMITVLCGLTEGLRASEKGGADPLVAIVLKEGRTPDRSMIPPGALDRVRLLPQIAKEGGALLVSPETVAPRLMSSKDGDDLEQRVVRGVDKVAFQVHRGVHLRGRFPEPLEAGVVIGANLLGTREGFVEGGVLQFDGQTWPVLGVIEAQDSPFSSEIWCDRAFFKRALKREPDNVVYVRLESADAHEELSRQAASWKADHLIAYSEAGFFREQLKGLAVYFDAVYVLLFILLASTILTSANTIYTSFLGRTREFATLMTIGYTRRRVMVMMTLESILLTMLGGLIGMGLAMLVHGRHFSLAEVAVIYSVYVTPRVLLLAAVAALTTGCLASLVANLQLLRMNVLAALRD